MPQDIQNCISENDAIGEETERSAGVPPLLFELVKAALTGLLANSSGRLPNSQVAREAVVLADLTLKELAREVECGRKRSEMRSAQTRNVQFMRWPASQ